jgi:hypothetical protein
MECIRFVLQGGASPKYFRPGVFFLLVYVYGWIPHNASFGFLDIASANVGVFASLDRF